MGTDEVDEDQVGLLLGLPHPWFVDEHPKRKLFLPAFYMDPYEVTHEEYHQFLQASGHAPPENWAGAKYPPDKARFPVVFVSWFDANHYCRWSGKRLPTEMEWEKAARGPHGMRYPWGNEFSPDLANVARGPMTFGSTLAVGHYEQGRSPYGIYDLIGNVWEWTDSWYEPYPGNPVRNEDYGEKLRVNRGLSFLGIGHYPPELHQKVLSIVGRASFRSYDYPSARLPDVGFRCAKSVN